MEPAMKCHIVRPRWLSVILLGALLLGPTALGLAHAAAAQGQVSITRDEFRRQLQEHYGFEEPQHVGGTVTVSDKTEIGHVNGILANDWPTKYITNLLFEGLVGLSPIDGAPVPQLADAWETSVDGLTHTFHLNQDATWHDGVDVTAADVKFSFDTAQDSELAGYRVIDDDTFEMVAKKPFVTFIYGVAGAVPIMPEHVWGDIPFEDWRNDPGTTGEDPSRVVGTGPFKFRAWDKGKSITLGRNDKHYATVPTIDQFVMRFMPQEERIAALQDGGLDLFEGIDGDTIEDERLEGSLLFKQFDVARIHGYTYNLDVERTPYFVDERVRKALFIAIDREAIVKEIYGYSTVAIGTQPPLSAAYAPERMLDPYDYDPIRARELLAEAGWVDTDGDGVVEKDGQDFRFGVLDVFTATGRLELSQFMANSWQAIGVETVPETVSWPEFQQRRDAHDFDMLVENRRLDASGNQGDLFRSVGYSGGRNYMGYANPEYDRLDDLQLLEFDPERRKELLIQASVIVWDDLPMGVLRYIGGTAAWSPRVHNFEPADFGGFFWSMPFVWVDA
jgi:peptide/nickel transport system substrate-binding protein